MPKPFFAKETHYGLLPSVLLGSVAAVGILGTLYYLRHPDDGPLKIDKLAPWSDAVENAPAAAEPASLALSGATMDYDPSLVVGGQTLFEDSAKKASSSREIIGSLPKSSKDGRNLAVPLYEAGASSPVPVTVLSNPPLPPAQLSQAAGLAEKEGRVEDFAAYSSDVDMPKMDQYPKPSKRTRAKPQPEPAASPDAQDLRAALSAETGASQSMVAGMLSSRSAQESRGRNEEKAARVGGAFDGSGIAPGAIKAVFDLSASSAPEQLVVMPMGAGASDASAQACASARDGDGGQMMALGEELRRTAVLMNSSGRPGCCDYAALQSWNASMLRLAQLCEGFNAASARLSIACRTPYNPVDCAQYRGKADGAGKLRCLAPFLAGLLLFLSGALLPGLGPLFMVFGGALAGGALLGGISGFCLFVVGAAGSVFFHGVRREKRVGPWAHM